ncbi:probable caffeine synthase MTL2 [Prosopis cineraria]|uniref:probable caffeine synthase MTL2 n=1 Tax=Prosopis cineraria TaxID=364024 RepID=UPI00240FAE7F|nr:probable caffeine synthase MTL2 [Prosopis cineraria]
MATMSAPVEQVLHMTGGDDETSYANNALITQKVMMRARPILEESIQKMYSTNLPMTCLKVADLGCSSGKNALLAVSNIIKIVDEMSDRLKVETPTFQIFLNDLFGNDFNSIFKSVPEFYERIKQDKAEKQHGTTCLINATPGSFYGTLFPSNSIHFFHSSYSLHYISQAPKWWSDEEAKLGDDEDNNIYVTSNSPPSYSEQFRKDFNLFVRSRSRELVLGGGMLLTFAGRYDTPQDITAPGLIRMILNNMVSQNLIEEARLAHFNVPFYTATENEVREIIKGEGSFSIERFESIKTSWDGSSLDEEGIESFEDDDERGEFVARYVRAIFEPLLKVHFGEGVMDELFLRFKNKVIQFLPKLVYNAFVISLVKIA